jgi:hypothetical protein
MNTGASIDHVVVVREKVRPDQDISFGTQKTQASEETRVTDNAVEV